MPTLLAICDQGIHSVQKTLPGRALQMGSKIFPNLSQIWLKFKKKKN